MGVHYVLCDKLHFVHYRLQKGVLSCQDAKVSTAVSKTVNPDIARWIEERDILLQTGVYTHNDLTIQTLDQKIKAALNT